MEAALASMRVDDVHIKRMGEAKNSLLEKRRLLNGSKCGSIATASIPRQGSLLAPNDYDLLTSEGEQGLEAALRCVRALNPALAQRGVPVPLEADQQPCSSSQTSLATPLQQLWTCNELRFEFRNLAKLVNECLNGEQAIDSQSRQMIIRLEEWLSEEQCRDSFSIRLCVHNPAYNPRLTYFCHSVLDQNGKAEVHRRTSELEEAVKKSNTVRARMIEMEKYDKYQINPIFGVCTSYRRRLNAPEYYVKGRKPVSRPSFNPQRSPTEFWEHQFPLHKYAFEGNHVKVRELLKQGHNPNELDNDCWTPLHYCAFYNRLQACEVLMLHPKTSVNAVNKTGATALHFAALNGHVFLVELILSHQFVDIADWQESAYLLANQLRPNKLEVQLVGGASLQVEAPNSQPTAGELRDAVLAIEGLSSPEAARIFAIWVTSQRLSLQLKAEQKVHVHLEKWGDHLEKWGDPLEPGMQLEEDQVRIVLRRDARTLLGDEQMLDFSISRAPIAAPDPISVILKLILLG
uniref:non-specific serine/threonine protein kinase n=1 Tax=Ditylenchus dipsaci TaxID=166011 RepID=A0A915CUK9_9BILA